MTLGQRVGRCVQAAVAVWLLSACTGAVSGPMGPEGSGEGPPRDVEYPEGHEEGINDVPVPDSRFPRLTHEQWENTVQDLFGLSERTGLSSNFRADSGGTTLFNNEGAILQVDASLWDGYERAAVAMADRVKADDTIVNRIAPAGGSAAERARNFITTFGLRAYRRPLTDEEIEEHLTLFNMGANLDKDVDAFHAGVGLTVEAMLQSPNFLYRIETSSQASGGKIPLNGYEIATRLSYALWDTMPDEELFAAAADDSLVDPSEVATQAERLIGNERARKTLERFHDALLATAGFSNVTPNMGTYPNVTANFGKSLLEESHRNVQDKLFDRDLGFGEFLTEPTTFVNAELAKVYNLSGTYSANDFVSAEFNENEKRAGLLTQAGFLALNATANEGDPIHRGVYLVRRISCSPLGTPPNNIPPLSSAMGTTMRERVVNLTEQAGTACAGCHGVTINPFGFPFEGFDASGAFRTKDHDIDVDTTSSVLLDGKQVPVTDAANLSAALAKSPQANGCYAGKWLEYAYGRAQAASDTSLTKRLGKASADGELSVKDLVLGLIVSDAFLTRSTTELED